jgi:hypothetical protein
MVIAMAPVIDIVVIEDAIRDDKLLERATLDCVQALMRLAVVGHSTRDAIMRLDQLRQQIERANHES